MCPPQERTKSDFTPLSFEASSFLPTASTQHLIWHCYLASYKTIFIVQNIGSLSVNFAARSEQCTVEDVERVCRTRLIRAISMNKRLRREVHTDNMALEAVSQIDIAHYPVLFRAISKGLEFKESGV